MPFTAAFTFSQSATGTSCTVTDTSDYSDEPHGDFTSRTLNIVDIYGNDLGPGNWPFSDGNTYTFALTPWDLAPIVTLTLVPIVVQSGSTYIKSALVVTTNYSYQFAALLGQNVGANPSIQNQVSYINNLQRLWTDILNAINMGTFSQQQSAQSYLDDIYYLFQNKVSFFG